MGTLVVISSPSGGGKNTIINRLLEIFPKSIRFVTTTTRAPRGQDTNGKDYHFVSHTEFQQLMEQKKFIEYNFYAGEYYGSERERLETDLQMYDMVFVALDVNGKEALDTLHIPHLAIFLLPEDMSVLQERIEMRGGTDEEAIKERLETATQEMKAAGEYDLQVVNPEGKMEEAVAKIVEFLLK